MCFCGDCPRGFLLQVHVQSRASVSGSVCLPVFSTQHCLAIVECQRKDLLSRVILRCGSSVSQRVEIYSQKITCRERVFMNLCWGIWFSTSISVSCPAVWYFPYLAEMCYFYGAAQHAIYCASLSQ